MVRTQPQNFDNKLAEQAATWMKDVDTAASEILITSSINTERNDSLDKIENKLPTGIDKEQVLFRDCPVGHANGPACTEANALAHVYYEKQLQEGKTFDWIYVVDDDVLVFPKHLSKALVTKNRSLVHGTPGCTVVITKEQIKNIELGNAFSKNDHKNIVEYDF